MQYKNFVNIQAYKYNGKLYRQWSGGKILQETENHVVLYMNNKTKVMEKNFQKWSIREDTLWFFHKKHFFNALVTIVNKKFYIYINLASPFFVEEHTVKFIDFDLDIKVYPNKDLNIIDKIEFLSNAKKMKYSQKTIDVVFEELKFLINLYYKETYIFNKKYLKYIQSKIDK
ncbi:DUF402 domain-containing protein [Mycoplasma sp. 480]|uniref:DUF402 domain-containing protein n=1 Tax=Mycoplasma sp. 480 TaxID=3440155 RepID=UPI003F5116AF